MPALSPTMEEGTLAKWLVKEGDEVSPGDVIAEIETDKATMEVEAVDEGTVGKNPGSGGDGRRKGQRQNRHSGGGRRGCKPGRGTGAGRSIHVRSARAGGWLHGGSGRTGRRGSPAGGARRTGAPAACG